MAAWLPTGAKVFLILVWALLPLALIALFTTLQTTRTADAEARARLRTAATESSGVLASMLANHIVELREGVAALESDRADAPGCTRVAGAFAALADTGTRFAITDRGGELLCGQRFSIAGASMLAPNQVAILFVENGPRAARRRRARRRRDGLLSRGRARQAGAAERLRPRLWLGAGAPRRAAGPARAAGERPLERRETIQATWASTGWCSRWRCPRRRSPRR
ncbi:MAG: hypothetical protein WDN24_15800 [Sphingomonas sp.]